MSRQMVPVMSVWRWISALCLTAVLIPLLGCATTPPIVPTPPIAEMAWVRTDGRKIADDPALLQQGRTDIAACNASLILVHLLMGREGAWRRRDTSLCEEIRQRTCARHTPQVLNNRVLRTDN